MKSLHLIPVTAGTGARDVPARSTFFAAARRIFSCLFRGRCGPGRPGLRLGPVLAALLLLAGSLFAGPRDAQWKKVQDALSKGLPQTAITNLDPIINAAMKEKAYAEAVKAIAQKLSLEGTIQGN